MQFGLMKSQMKENLSEYIPRKIMQETLFNPRYRSIDKIGSGSFGEIHKVYDVLEKKLRAVKIEKKDKRGSTGMLAKEAYIMKQMSNCHHFPRLIEDSESGPQSNDMMSFIIMSFLGANLESLKKKHTKLSNYTTLLIGCQMVEALMLMHKKGFLHRDIKPENFVIGTEGNHHNIYIIDFGLSKKYLDTSKNHIAEDNNKGLVGTARYTSINSHKGIEQSRRDDLESLGYVLIYLAKGELPWQNLTQEKREEKFEQIKKLKIDTKIEELTRDLPSSFRVYMEHVKGLEFEEEPNYTLLKDSFLKDAVAIQKSQLIPLECSHCLDWCVRGTCSIEKKFAEKINQKKKEQAKLVAKAEEISSRDQEIPTSGIAQMCNADTEDRSDPNRRETQFTQTPNFYSDTVEKPSEFDVFEVPLFKPDSSLAISKNSIATMGTFNAAAVGNAAATTNGVDLCESGQVQKKKLLGQPKGGVLVSSAILSQEFDEQHSQNSSEYNNISNDYAPNQEEHAVVQKVVQSYPVQFSVKENKKNFKSGGDDKNHD